MINHLALLPFAQGQRRITPPVTQVRSAFAVTRQVRVVTFPVGASFAKRRWRSYRRPFHRTLGYPPVAPVHPNSHSGRVGHTPAPGSSSPSRRATVAALPRAGPSFDASVPVGPRLGSPD